MRICVCGAQSPFMRGGAEMHMENLTAALRRGGHQVELVRLPVSWPKDHLLDSAFAWRLVHLECDAVIATNFPSYFVRHERKIVWLFHQHRAAYDGLGSPWSDLNLDDTPLTIHRQLVDWDTRVLAEACHLFSTSRRVAERLHQFNGLLAEPLYHPPPLFELIRPGEFGDYIFCATRLEGNKRPDLMVEALAASRAPVRLLIAGEGSMEPGLRQRIVELGLDERVQLLGFVDDERLMGLLAGALAVMYVPYDEDYGYVTLQAFRAGKPVITTDDSGGVLEWVEEERTGLVAPPVAAQLGELVDRLAASPSMARRIGDEGRRRVEGLSWRAVVERLLEPL